MKDILINIVLFSGGFLLYVTIVAGLNALTNLIMSFLRPILNRSRRK